MSSLGKYGNSQLQLIRINQNLLTSADEERRIG